MSLRSRYLLLLLSLCLILVAGMVIPGYFKIRELEMEEANRLLRHVTGLIESDIQRAQATLERSGVSRIPDYVAQSQERVLKTIRADYTLMLTDIVIFDRDKSKLLEAFHFHQHESNGVRFPRRSENARLAGEVLTAIYKHQGEEQRWQGAIPGWMVTTWRDDSWGWHVAVTLSDHEVHRDSLAYVKYVLVAALLMLLLVSTLYLIIGYRFNRRLDRLTSFILGFSRGNLSNRLPEPETDEMGRLESALNAMAERVEREIGTRKRAESKLKKAKNEAEEASRAKSLFMAKMSHEMRNPLNAIMGFSNLMQNTLDASQAQGIGRKIVHAARNLRRTVEDILDISKIEQGVLKLVEAPFSLRDEIIQIMESFKLQSLPDDVTLEYAVDQNVPDSLVGDSLRISQVVINLVENSIRHTQRGVIRLEVRTEEETEDSYQVRIEVTDTGSGIDHQVQQKIFEDFHSGDHEDDQDSASSGLGLAIVHSIVSAMEGTIEVESEPDRGSCFTVILPLGKALTGRQGGQDASIDDDTDVPHGLTVLVAEDDALNREYISYILDKMDIAHRTANDGNEALEELRQHTFDALLLDMRMPNMNGEQTMKAIREQLPAPARDIPIVVLSANAFPDQIDKYLVMGANACLAKPFDSASLAAALGEVCGMRDNGTRKLYAASTSNH